MAYRPSRAAELSGKLAGQVEVVCRRYLPAGRREGRYWMVGDVTGTPGRSLYVRLFETGNGVIGNWVDAATGEHGDLLDLIRLNQGHRSLAEAIAEAERFLSLPSSPADETSRQARLPPVTTGTPAAARRLFAAAQPIIGTLGETYLQSRGIMNTAGLDALRFHPRCFYRPGDRDAPGTPRALPALIASVTDSGGVQMGAHRTWLDPSGKDKASLASPRRAMGSILGNAIRFGSGGEAMAIGEGIETMLSLREALPLLLVVAATSSAHLAAFAFPPALRRLYVARDRDAAGDAAYAILTERTGAAGIELLSVMPQLGDFNDDLRAHGPVALRELIVAQLHEADRARFYRR